MKPTPLAKLTIATMGLIIGPGLRAQSALPAIGGPEPLGAAALEMEAGIGRFLDRQVDALATERAARWHPEYSSQSEYERSVAPNRSHLATMIGAVDRRPPVPQMECVATTDSPALAAETDRFSAYAVRWPVLEGVYGEGLLLRPKGAVRARVVAIPDADQTPEMIAGLSSELPPARQFARRLAESGCLVIVPTLIDRSDRFSGNAALGVYTNEPGREWIYRQAFEFGRHPIGFEVEKIQSAVDWLERGEAGGGTGGIGVAGWGEGGLLAFYSAALEPRISAALVSGYFGPREELWREPIYRNVFGLLREFGDAELARLVVPRVLAVEYAPAPDVNGPPAPRRGRRTSAAPGRIVTPPLPRVAGEVARAQQLSAPYRSSIRFFPPPEGEAGVALREDSLLTFLQALNPAIRELAPPGGNPRELRRGFDPLERQGRQVAELGRYCQGLIAASRLTRADFFWDKVSAKTPAGWRRAVKPYREILWNDVIGRVPAQRRPPQAEMHQIYDEPGWTGYAVKLDVFPDVFAFGYLLLPKNLAAGEKRSVVVMQHGLENGPADVLNQDRSSKSFGYYQDAARRLLARGYILFLPQNPYWGGDRFRVLQRKANPLQESIFSFILEQHAQILAWLGAQAWADPSRIGFYGLSYGGKTALRVPALLDGYCLSICTADFNEWVYKIATTDWPGGYPFSGEYELPEFNLAGTFNHAEMAALIAPRPFMVERGHYDTVGTDEWVAFEYAKVRRAYDQLGIPERTEIDFFNGPHQMHLVGSLEFLQRFLPP